MRAGRPRSSVSLIKQLERTDPEGRQRLNQSNSASDFKRNLWSECKNFTIPLPVVVCQYRICSTVRWWKPIWIHVLCFCQMTVTMSWPGDHVYISWVTLTARRLWVSMFSRCLNFESLSWLRPTNKLVSCAGCDPVFSSSHQQAAIESTRKNNHSGSSYEGVIRLCACGCHTVVL